MPTKKPTKPQSTIVPDNRCKYVASSGRRCRVPAARDTSRASGYSAFCLPHSQMEQQYLEAESVSEELIGKVYDFWTTYAVNDVLGRLLVLVAENRIPLRNATAVAYICQLLLTSNVGLRYEYNVRAGREGERFLIDHAIDMIHPQPKEEETEDEEEDEEEDKEEENKPAQPKE